MLTVYSTHPTMPYCTTCGVYFDGRGTHCTLHNPYLQAYTARPSSAADIRRIGYRTGTTPRPRKRFQLGYSSSSDSLAEHDARNTLVRYTPAGAVAPYADAIPPPSSPLASAFTLLTHANALTSLTYSVSPHGTHSIIATANPEREQCPVCLQFFPDRRRLDAHLWEFPIGCELHSVCMREEDVEWHAVGERHERCFVKDCRSVYRREGGWKRSVVLDHVRDWHRVV